MFSWDQLNQATLSHLGPHGASTPPEAGTGTPTLSHRGLRNPKVFYVAEQSKIIRNFAECL